MRKIWLIAGRDLKEIIATKGFWFGILLFPVMMVVIGGVQAFFATQAPVRHFVLMDRSGEFEAAVDREMARRQARDAMSALHDYLRANLDEPGKTESRVIDLLGADDLPPAADIPDAAVTAFMEAGGVEAELERVAPALGPEAPEFTAPRPSLRRVPLPRELRDIADSKEFIAALRPYFEGSMGVSVKGAVTPQPLDAAVFIPADFDTARRPEALAQEDGRAGVRVWSTNPPATEVMSVLEASLGAEVRRNAYRETGLAAETIGQIEAMRVPITQYRALGEATDEEVSLEDLVRQFLPVGLAFLLFQALMFTVSPLLTNTVEEKSNRIIEVLLSSATPHEVMIGKLLAAAGMGGIVVSAWLGFGSFLLALGGGVMDQLSAHVFDLFTSTFLLPAFLFYFLLGYTMLSGIFVTIGGMCNTIKEAQNLMAPVMIIMILPILSIGFVPRDPHGTLAVALSWFPLSAPFVMMSRITANPPLWEVIGTGIVIVGTAGGILWASGKLFRRSILRGGGVTGFRDLWALLRP